MTDADSKNLGPTRGPLVSLDASAPVGRLLEQTTAAFEAVEMPLARRWAETLVAAILDVPHEELKSHAGRKLDPEQGRRFEEIARQASPDVPLAYAVGRAPFLDLDFEVSRDTLIPKVDTELFVGTVLDELARSPLPPEPHVLELCTGSGCLAIFLADRLPGARVVATDVSREALAVAGRNVLHHGVGDRVALGLGDVWEPVAALAAGRPFDLIVSNPPYVPAETDELPQKGLERAWDAGTDGRVLLDRIIDEAPDHLRPGGFLLLVSSSILGTDLTLQAMRDAGLEDVDVVARQRGPLGPLMLSRVHTLEERGMLKPGQRHEDVIIVRGRQPERVGWRLPTDAELAASA